jgi:hypothetical protein
MCMYVYNCVCVLLMDIQDRRVNTYNFPAALNLDCDQFTDRSRSSYHRIVYNWHDLQNMIIMNVVLHYYN